MEKLNIIEQAEKNNGCIPVKITDNYNPLPSLEKVEWYMGFAEQAAKRSPDEETKVGSCLVNVNTGAVVAVGFNGFARQAPDHLLPKVRPDKHQYVIHAEVNLITNCARHGIATEGFEVYCTLSPCANCMRVLWQSGIKRVYIRDFYREFETVKLLKDLHVEVISYGPYHVLEYSPNV